MPNWCRVGAGARPASQLLVLKHCRLLCRPPVVPWADLHRAPNKAASRPAPEASRHTRHPAGQHASQAVGVEGAAKDAVKPAG